MHKRGILAVIMTACVGSISGSAEEKRPWLDALRELWARHPAWYAYDKISSQYVVSIPLDKGFTTSPVEGGPKRIGRDPEIYLYATSSNEMHTLRGELRVMKKNGKDDVLEAFKKLNSQEDGERDTSEAVISGNRSEGQYALVYRTRDGSITNEKIMNLYNDFALSYRIYAKPGTKEEEQAQNMVADFALLRRCSHENAGDDECLRDGEEL